MNTSPSVIKLTVGGSHVPSFKNNKMLARGRLITNPKNQKWMEQCIQNFVYQLNSGSAIIEEETLMGPSRQSSIALLQQLRGLDDSRQWIPELHVYTVETSKGNEGAEITIERI